jgi:hypothetical protein
MKNTLEKIIDKLENDTGATWSVYDCNGGGSFEISTYSPAGENVIISLDGSTLAELAADVRNAAEAFDAEEHAAIILVAKRSGTADERRFYADAPDSLRELLEDAEAIKALYESLAAALCNA